MKIGLNTKMFIGATIVYLVSRFLMGFSYYGSLTIVILFLIYQEVKMIRYAVSLDGEQK